MNTNTNNKILCESIMRNSFQFGNIRAGYVSTSVLCIDGEYQRSPQSRIRKIAENWDDNKCGFLTVNYRPEENRFAIIDGQNRYTAACLRGIDSLPCHILNGVSKEDEAKFFATQDENRVKVTPFDKFRAELIYGDTISMLLQSMCEDYGIIIAPSNPKQTRHLRSITTAKEIIRVSGEEALRWIFDVIKACGWHTARHAYSAVMIRGLYGFYNHCVHSSFSVCSGKGALITALKTSSPDKVIAMAHGFRRDDNEYSSLTRLFIELTKY